MILQVCRWKDSFIIFTGSRLWGYSPVVGNLLQKIYVIYRKVKQCYFYSTDAIRAEFLINSTLSASETAIW